MGALFFCENESDYSITWNKINCDIDWFFIMYPNLKKLDQEITGTAPYHQ